MFFCLLEANAGNHKLDAIGKIIADDNRVSVNVSNLDMLSGVGFGEQLLSPRNAWVRCDDCHKWRRIPAVLADRIDETNCTWYTMFHAYYSLLFFYNFLLEAEEAEYDIIMYLFVIYFFTIDFTCN